MPGDGLRREAARLAAALTFLPRIPVPRPAGHAFEADAIVRAARYFPGVGILVGGAEAAMLLGASMLWTGPIPARRGLGTTRLLPGAFHEDGLADTADGFGGHTAAQRLAIMKDSRLGSYGVLALAIVLATRVAAVSGMPGAAGAASVLFAHAGGRAASVLVMALVPYAGDPLAAKVRQDGRVGPCEAAFAILTGLAPLPLMGHAQAAAALAGGSLCAALVAWRTCRALGGQTGDVLGAVTTVFATAALLGAAAFP